MATDPSHASNQNLQVVLASVGPILSHLPKWIELGSYSEFGDDEVRVCELCHDVCEWVYFKLLQLNSDGLELCGSCLEKHKKPTPWTLYVREGLIFYLGSLNAVAGSPAVTKSGVGLKAKSSSSLQFPAPTQLRSPTKSGSPGHSFEQPPSGQLLEPGNFEPDPHSRPLLLTASSEPLVGARTSEPPLLKSNSEPIIFDSNSEQVIFTPNTEPVLVTTNAEPVQFASKSDPIPFPLSEEAGYFPSHSAPMRFSSDPEIALFARNTESAQFVPHGDPTLLTSNSEPVLFTSNAEPVHFLSHSKPAVFTSNSEAALFRSPYPESAGAYSESLGLIPKSEPVGFTATSDSVSFTSTVEAQSKPLQAPHQEPSLFSSGSSNLPTTPSSELSQSNSDLSVPTSESSLVRTHSKSGKKVSDGTLVDRMRTIVQQDCRLGKDLFTTGIELAERYNSCYKHETIHVRRVFEAMKTLGYTASKDTMQVQVQKVRRKVKLIYGLAMK